jgi:hypothetical protein
LTSIVLRLPLSALKPPNTVYRSVPQEYATCSVWYSLTASR